MDHKDAYPYLEAKLRLFLKNLVDNIDKATSLMGLPANTFEAIKKAGQTLLDAYDQRDKARKVLDTAQSTVDTQAPLTETQVRAFIQQVKKTMGIPAEVLDLLELNTATTDAQARVGAESPLLKSRMDGIHPSISGLKHGYSAVEIWSRRAAETDFTLLAVATHLPFLDNRPNAVPEVAEIREYYGYYQKKNVVVSGRGATTIPLSVPGGPHV